MIENIWIGEIKDFDPGLIDSIKALERRNLGEEASLNEWMIPVIIRYGKMIVAVKAEEEDRKLGNRKQEEKAEMIQDANNIINDINNIINDSIREISIKEINNINNVKDERNSKNNNSENNVKSTRYFANEIIGVCELIKSWDDDRKAFIHSFYIDRPYRSKGVGKKLLRGTLEILKREGIKSLELTVDPKNEVAIKLYERFGFKVEEYRKDEYGKGIDRYLMKLNLKES